MNLAKLGYILLLIGAAIVGIIGLAVGLYALVYTLVVCFIHAEQPFGIILGTVIVGMTMALVGLLIMLWKGDL